MTETGISRKEINIIPIADGRAHLQNEIDNYKCHICKVDGDDMVLLRKTGKTMIFACLDHPGVVQEFIKQFKRPPLGWICNLIGDDYEPQTGCKEDRDKDSSL